jgi:hypothetical protein
MLRAVIPSLLAGPVGGSGFPHFVQGIAGEEFPCALGNSAAVCDVVA